MDLMGSVTVIRWGKQRAHTEEEQHNGCAVDQEKIQTTRGWRKRQKEEKFEFEMLGLRSTRQ
eukprot:4660772-Ditylum_brightwellii.AAC.1